MREEQLQRCTDCGGKPYVSVSGYIHISCDKCDALVEVEHTSYEAAYFYWEVIQNQKAGRET
jgi:phage FluMu protein Com